MVVKAHCLTSMINQFNSNHGWATFQTTAFSDSIYEYANLKHIAHLLTAVIIVKGIDCGEKQIIDG